MALLVAYLRVSTVAQAEDGLGLDVQQQAIERWAAAGGHTLVATFRDEGISGTKDAADRPGLASALAAVEDGAEGLVVYKLDRLARALTVQEAVLAQVWKSGGRAWAVDVGEVLRDDPDDPMRTAMRQMVGVFAQLERAMIAARMRAGRRLKAQRGC
jgi:DNA invertase Pin-like site-specific DNA recombinase